MSARSLPAVTAGLRREHPDLALVWIDAHGDLNTPETTPSGFLGGMPFAVLLGWCHDELRAAAGLEPALAAERAALVGARDLDPGERDAIARSRLVVADDVAGALTGLADCTYPARTTRRSTTCSTSLTGPGAATWFPSDGVAAPPSTSARMAAATRTRA